MKADGRREEIADYILRAGQARIDDLVAHFGVSRMTIHRHVDALARQGMLRKLHGLVTVEPSGLYESAFRYRETVARAEKEALARAAMAHVEPGQAVMLDDSSTASALVPLLPEARPLTVITNSRAAAESLVDIDEVDLIGLGGKYHRHYNAYLGILCEKAVASLRANVLFCSASAIDGATAFIQDPEITKIKQAMMASARRRILIVDSSKFGKVALNVLDRLDAFDAVLTTDRVPEEERARLVEAGVNLEIVKTVRTT